MMSKLTPEHTSAQILLFLGMVALISVVYAFIFLQPAWQKLENLQKQSIQLNQQWQKQQAAISRHQQLQRDMAVLQYSYSARLQSLHRSFSSTELYAQINALAASHALKIMAVKPQKHQIISGLQQQIFNISLAGSELKVLSFLDLLMHQSWLLELQQISLISLHTGEGIQLQAVMAAYHD
jgi:Tfp pilus assembly protein PilO